MPQTKAQKRYSAYIRVVEKLARYPSLSHLAEAESLHRRVSHVDPHGHFGIEVNYTAGLLRRMGESRPDRKERLIAMDKLFERVFDVKHPLLFSDFLDMVNDRENIAMILRDERQSVCSGYEEALIRYLEQHTKWLSDDSITGHPRHVADKVFLSIPPEGKEHTHVAHA